jgi:hypothetical protein
LLNATWLTGTKDRMIRGLWQTSDPSSIPAATVNSALSGTTGLL